MLLCANYLIKTEIRLIFDKKTMVKTRQTTKAISNIGGQMLKTIGAMVASQAISTGAKRVGTFVGNIGRSRKPKKARTIGAGAGPRNSSKVTKGYAGTVRGKNVKTKGSKKRAPKVSKNFKNKVLKVTAKKDPIGRWTQYSHGMIPVISGSGLMYNSQQVFTTLHDGLGAELTTQAPSPFLLFNPGRINDVAASMYNGKSPTNDWSNGTGNFAAEGLKINVLYQSAKITCRNNSGQTKEIDWYECVSKGNVSVDASAHFTAALAEAAADGRMNEVLTSTYGAGPHLSNNFKNSWKYKKNSMLLAPGQTASLYIKGPKMEYDYNKFHADSNQTTEVEFVKGVTVSMFGILRNPDLTRAVTTTPTFEIQNGHLQGVLGAWDGGVVCEIAYKYVINAPTQTAEARMRDKVIYLHTKNPWASVTADPTALARISTKTENILFSNNVAM